MKKTSAFSILLLMLATLVPALSFQQTPNSNQQTLFPTNNSQALPVDYVYGTEGSFKSNVKLNEINIHAFKHFLKNFPTSTNEYWLKTNLGYIVKFYTEEIRNDVFYKLNGDFQYSVRYYEEKDLDKDLRKRIHRDFHGYQIALIIETSDWDRVFYTIKITNRKSIKTIQFCDGKLEIIEDLKNLAE